MLSLCCSWLFLAVPAAAIIMLGNCHVFVYLGLGSPNSVRPHEPAVVFSALPSTRNSKFKIRPSTVPLPRRSLEKHSAAVRRLHV
jgi:hypothetical protein